MKISKWLILLSIQVTILLSCQLLTPKQTPVATETDFPRATNTLRPTATMTEAPSPVPLTETPSFIIMTVPPGTILSSWNDIPIMPGALAGGEIDDGKGAGYVFTVRASADEVKTFYKTELGKLGWEEDTSMQSLNDSVRMFFMKSGNLMPIIGIPQPDNIMYVILGRF